CQVLFEQFAPTLGHRMWVQADELGNPPIPAVPSLSDSRPAYKRRCFSFSMLENRTIAAFNSPDTTSALAKLLARFGSAGSTCRASSWRSRGTGLIEQYRDNPPTGSRATRSCCTSFSNGSLVPTWSKGSNSSAKCPAEEFSTK